MKTTRTNWKREKFVAGFVNLSMTSGDTLRTKAKLLGNVALHQDSDYKRGGWTITHIPSGLAVPRACGSLKTGQRAARFWARVLEPITDGEQVTNSPRCTRAWRAWINWIRRNG